MKDFLPLFSFNKSRKMNKSADFLVIGSGIGGLTFALKAAEHGSVIVIAKDDTDQCNTHHAQGGICSVTYPPDTFEKHIEDTLVCGVGLCDRGAVEQVVCNAPAAIADLIEWGVEFDKRPDGKYDLAREGGHSESRILHHRDFTGAEIQRALDERVRRHKNIEVLEHHFAIDLLTQHHLGVRVTKESEDIECYGAYVLDLKSRRVGTYLAKVTVLAAGGVGNIYRTTTNPLVATGDGIAMAKRALAVCGDMEFIQFHPTALYNPGERPSFLISEAMRGYGAVLKLQSGEEFMDRYHHMGSLAPRDIVARSIHIEMQKSGAEYVYLDVTHKDSEETIAKFPQIYKKCLSLGIDITKQLIPITPAAHYCCGGVKVDYNGQSSIDRLYAIGETSFTGLHGGNRLASNSLIEAAVYAKKAAEHSTPRLGGITVPTEIADWYYKATTDDDEKCAMVNRTQREIQRIMGDYVGIARSDQSLQRAMDRLSVVESDVEEIYQESLLSRALCELRNMVTVGKLVIEQASARKESIGLHYSLDYPPKKQ